MWRVRPVGGRPIFRCRHLGPIAPAGLRAYPYNLPKIEPASSSSSTGVASTSMNSCHSATASNTGFGSAPSPSGVTPRGDLPEELGCAGVRVADHNDACGRTVARPGSVGGRGCTVSTPVRIPATVRSRRSAEPGAAHPRGAAGQPNPLHRPAAGVGRVGAAGFSVISSALYPASRPDWLPGSRRKFPLLDLR
jgi:hypothetical protein